MQKLWVSLCVEQNHGLGVGGGGAGLGGYLEMYTSGSNTQMSVCQGIWNHLEAIRALMDV